MLNPSPLQSLADHVAAAARSPEATALAARIAPRRPWSSGETEVPDLSSLLARRDADGRPAIVIQERLAAEAPSLELAALGLLTMLRADLEAVRDRLVRSGRVSALDAEIDTLGAAWEVVTTDPPPGRWDRADAIWTRARRVSAIRRSSTRAIEPLPATFDVAEPEIDWPGFDGPRHWPGVLSAAIAAGVLSPREVVLIASTRVEGYSLAEVARALGRPYDASCQERRRAERALRRFLACYDSEDS